MWDASTQGFSLKNLKHLVLDEADKLLDMDFEQEIDAILKVIPREGRRTQLFSATMTSKVQKLQRACLVSPVKVSCVAILARTAAAVCGMQQRVFARFRMWALRAMSSRAVCMWVRVGVGVCVLRL